MTKKTKELFEAQYIRAIDYTLQHGFVKPNRTGINAISANEPVTFRVNVRWEGVPLLRGKKMFPDKPVREALWIMLGRNDIGYLKSHGVNYWDKFDLGDGTIGNSYGPRVRDLNGFDQLEYVANEIKNNPSSRQIVMSFWNPTDDAKIKPCYGYIQFIVTKNYLNMYVTQRSGDAFLGVPNDAIVFTTMMVVLSNYAGLSPGYLHFTINDFHIYDNHLDAVTKYIRQSRGWRLLYQYVSTFLPYHLKTKQYNHIQELLDDLAVEETIFKFDKYFSEPFIKADLAI